ncbi:JAB domain-containing protein [Spongiibacter marinus]|uniref:JAB domain-containing protein n=1 Tax=Spongiibacter marinus TaxID=354246 RepID=UPI003567C3BD
MINELNETKAPQYFADLSHNQRQVVEAAIEILGDRLKKGEQLTSAEVVKDYCRLQVSAERDEQFCCIFLDNQHCMIAFERLFRGTIDGASVHPRVVVRRSLELNAAAVILVHNHPSGKVDPSDADIRITRRLREALGVVDVRVLDHIVVGDTGCCSLAQEGRL